MPFCATPWKIGVSMTFGIDRGLQRFEHVAAGQVDRGGALPLERNLRALRGDHRQRHVLDVTAGEIVRLHLIDGEVEPGFARAHVVRDDHARRNPDQAHADQGDDAERNAGGDRADPQSERKVIQEREERDDQDEDDDHAADGYHGCLLCSDGFDEDACAFDAHDADRGSLRDELSLSQHVDPASVDRRDARGAQITARGAVRPRSAPKSALVT